MARDIYFTLKNPQRLHELMYFYDTPFGTYYPSENNQQNGKSAYEIAVEQGFTGTVEEWLNSLKGSNGITPHIGENGNWFIGDIDTEIAAAANNIIPIPSGEIDLYFQNNSNSENISPLSTAELDKLFI